MDRSRTNNKNNRKKKTRKHRETIEIWFCPVAARDSVRRREQKHDKVVQQGKHQRMHPMGQSHTFIFDSMGQEWDITRRSQFSWVQGG